jgi:hypothetical protein
VRALFTQAARFQSWLDVEAALADLTIIPAEMPDSSWRVQPNRCPRRRRLGQLPRDDMLVSQRAALRRNEKKNRSCQILVIRGRNSAPPIHPKRERS